MQGVGDIRQVDVADIASNRHFGAIGERGVSDVRIHGCNGLTAHGKGRIHHYPGGTVVVFPYADHARGYLIQDVHISHPIVLPVIQPGRRQTSTARVKNSVDKTYIKFFIAKFPSRSISIDLLINSYIKQSFIFRDTIIDFTFKT